MTTLRDLRLAAAFVLLFFLGGVGYIYSDIHRTLEVEATIAPKAEVQAVRSMLDAHLKHDVDRQNEIDKKITHIQTGAQQAKKAVKHIQPSVVVTRSIVSKAARDGHRRR